MIGLSYQVSPLLKESLQKIEALRRQILLAPLPPKTELYLRFEANINRLYWSVSLTGNSLSKNDVVKLITHEHKKRLAREQREVVGYKRALDYISQEWLVSPKPVTAKTIRLLHGLAAAGSLRLPEAKLKPFLDYLQLNPENPVVQAAIAQMQIIQLAPFTDGNGRVARLLALLFLYKYGYDFRGMLVLEEYWRKDLSGLRIHTENAIKTGNVTSWLEYFARAAETQLEKTVQLVSSPRFDLAVSRSFWELNERQKEILTLLEQPDMTIRNKKVQQRFRVSQITASRDLAKLATLGLIFPRGRGRSIFYTRV